MFNRKESAQLGKDIPQEWCEKTQGLFQENYQNFCQGQNQYFDVFGRIYSEEIVLAVSLLHQVELQLSPTTVFLSADIQKDEKNPDKILNAMVDLTGLIFDEITSDQNWNDYHDRWLSTTFKNHTFFYKITRENVRLTLEANAILKDQEQ